MDVVLVRWPADRQRRERLRIDNVPRLLLVEEGPPPGSPDCFEDWIRVPAEDEDLQIRLAGLRSRLLQHGVSRPDLDADGVLRNGDRWVSLPPVEARLTSALLERFGAVVRREALARAGWPEGAPGRNALDVHVLRLRRRMEQVGLVIRTVRSRGYLLESEVRQETVAQA
ncbi:MAG: helix-turn-helix domain-containing protein [Acidobacteria bacterium]|nr:helix-turn-helix domain-containing protein [Acidobacteriota bacterium]